MTDETKRGPGRPALSATGGRASRVTVWLPADVAAELAAEAKRLGAKESELGREAIEAHLPRVRRRKEVT